MTTVGLLLAAGLSRRFGQTDKLLADFRGRPLVSHAAAALRAVPLDHRIAVVSSGAVAALLDGFTCVRNASPEDGQGTSLALGAAGAARLGAGRLLIVLGDMPLVTPAHLQAVLDRCTDLTPSATIGARRMPPACFPAPYLERLAAATGDTGASALLKALPESALVTAPEAMLHDVDTPEALARLP